MGAGDFLNDAVGAEQSQETGDPAGPPAAFDEVGGGAQERRAHVPVSKAVERPFAATDGLQQRGLA